MIREDIDITKYLLNEIELLNYIDLNTAIEIHYKMIEIKKQLLNVLETTKTFDIPKLGDEMRKSIHEKIDILTENINTINNFIDNIYNVPEIPFKNFMINLN